MKDSNKQELTPVYIHEANYSESDKITLVDIAMLIIRHKKVVTIITSTIIALGTIAVLLAPKTYTFSTSIEIGSQIIEGTIRPFESPKTLLAKIRHVFIPQTQIEQQANLEEKYKIKASIPKDSEIIILEIKGTEDNADLMKHILQSITQKATLDHSRIYDSVRKNIISQLTQANTELQRHKQTNTNETAIIMKQNLIETYSSQLANLRNTHEISPPIKSLKPSGTSKKLIIIIAVFAGIILGVFSAFFAEFIEKVKEKSINISS